MNNNRFLKTIIPKTNIYVWITALMNLVIMSYNIYLGIVGFVLIGFLIFYNWKMNHAQRERWTKYIETLSEEIDTASKYSLINIPFPLCIINNNGEISWYNGKFSEMLEEKDILNENIERFIPSLDINRIFEDKESLEVKVKDKAYRVFHNVFSAGSGRNKERFIILYWINISNFNKLKEMYNNEKANVAVIQVDNYDDVLNNTEEGIRPLVTAEIDRRINLWASRMNAIIKKYSNDKYLVIFENRYLENLENKKFTILDDIREIDVGNKIPPTLSMGVGVGGKTLNHTEEYAITALELALGRGGDQAVVRKIDTFEFYGGKTKAVEKRNKVKARIIAHALRQLIDQSSKVIIVGHKIPDMDSFGAAIGVYRAALNRGKDAYIVIDEISPGIENAYAKFAASEGYEFINCNQAMEELDEKTLIVVVDTHRPSIIPCPGLFAKSNNIVLIDHHRRGTEFIENTVLTYLEPYASSTCELVTEILNYMDDKLNLEKIEAEALLAGIALDTKDFSFKTGVRTFEAAAILKRAGADTIEVRQLFQDDLETFIARANVVRNAQVYFKGIAISLCNEDIPNVQLVAAQGADELLNIKGITTSFVIGKKGEDNIFISGRSLGNINVQRVLEKLGGGGHLTVAGTQIQGVTIEEAKEMLIKTIEEYLEEGEK